MLNRRACVRDCFLYPLSFTVLSIPERLERNRSLRRDRPHARERAQPSAASAAVWLRPTSSVAAGLGLSDTLVELEIMILDS